MGSDLEFSFVRLTDQAKRHIRVFQLHQFLDRFAMGMTVAVVALALTDRGMDLFQISLLFGVYSLTTMVTELPFGGLADAIGRKPVFLAAVAASIISITLFLSTNDFEVLAMSFAFIGFGRALRSGTLDAWFLETFKRAAPSVDLQPSLAMVQWAGAMGLALGAVLGGLLPDILGPYVQNWGASVYDASYAMSLAVMLLVFVNTVILIKEDPRPLNMTALKQGVSSVPMVMRDAGRLAIRHPALSVLLSALAFFLMGTNPVEVIWPTHAKPMLDEGYANTAIGILTALYFFSIAFGAWLSPRINRFFRRAHGVTLAATFAFLAGLQIVLAWQTGIVGFVIVFVVFSVALGVSETPASSILHRHVQDNQRSTMLSLRSLVQQLGAAVGLILAGAIAEIYSTPASWIVGAAFLLIAACLMGILSRRLAQGID